MYFLSIVNGFSNMIKRKSKRDRGKVPFSVYFQAFDAGEKVSILRELSQDPKFPHRIQGRTGVVINKRGSSYVVKVNDFNMEKEYIIHPVHLKKVR